MSTDNRQDTSVFNLGKRWLKNQLSLRGDPRRAYRERQESEAIETELKERAEENVGRAIVGALLPPGWKRKLDAFQQQQEEHQAAETRRRRAEHEARPRATIHLSLSGDLDASFTSHIPVTLEQPHTAGDPYVVILETLDPIPVSGQPFSGFQFAIPTYTAPGTYDLSSLTVQHGTDDWDPYWFQLWLGSIDEPFFWTPDYGLATIAVSPDERTFTLHLTMQDAASRNLTLDATISLP